MAFLDSFKTNSAVNAEKANIQTLESQLGGLILGKYKSGQPFDGDIAAVCEQIKACESKIDAILAEAQAKKERELQMQAAARASAPYAQPLPQYQAPVQPGVSCPSCGLLNPAGTKFCQNCGTKIELPPPPQPIICACGAENAPGTKFCGECGAKLS